MAAAVLGGGLFAFDLLMPRGVAGGLPYVALVLAGLMFARRRNVLLLAGAATGLTILGFVLSPNGAPLWIDIANRALALLAIWVTAGVLWRWRGENPAAKNDHAESETPEPSLVLQTAVDSMAQGFTAFDADNRLVAFNDKVSDYFGYPPGFLRIGMSHEEIFRYRIAQGSYGDGDPEEILPRLLERSKNTSERSAEHTRPNGRSHIFQRSPMPGGGYVNTYTDITRLKNAERDAAAKSDLLEGIFKTGGTGFYIVDQNRCLIDFNKTYEELMGFPEGFLQPGISLDEITRKRHEMGHFEDRDIQEVLGRRQHFAESEHLGENTLPNGKSYIYRRRPLPQGGYVTSFTETTALKKAEREAAEKSAYLEGILKSGVAAFCIVDADFNLVEYNEAYEKLFGFPKGFLRPGLSREEITSYRLEAGHFGDENLEQALTRRTQDRRKEKFAERTLPDGTSYVYYRKLLPGGGYVTTYIETTELNKARQDAAEKTKILDTALEIMGQGFIVYDSEQKVAAYNTKFVEMAGLPDGCDISGMRHEDVLRLRAKAGKPVERLTEEVIKKRVKGQRDGREVIHERVRNDGTAFIYHRVPLPGGGNVCTFIDISEQKRAEAALLANQAQLTLAQEMARIGSWELDLVTGELTWSEEIYRMFEVNPNEFGASYEAFLNFVHPDDRVMVNKTYKESLETHEPYHIGHRLLMTDGRVKLVEERCQTWYDDDGKPIRSVGTVQDVTEQRRTEQELHQAQKMEVVGQLTGGVAHDFNNLLAVILGNAEMLADEAHQPNKKIDAVLRAASRGAELTQRLLSFSRRQSLFPRSLDTAPLIEDLLDLMRRTLGEHIDVTTRYDAGLWPAHVDPGQLENALLNLAINARDAMPDGGKLTISCANTVLDNDFLPISGGAPGQDYVVIAVSDSGAGMSEDVLGRAFEPFFTTKDVGKGSGLGLSMVYGFAKQSGGHVTIDSKQGWGTTVRLYLPRGEPVEPGDELARPETGHAQRNTRILVIEDDPQVQDVVETMLGALGHSIVTAGSCQEGMDALRREPFDLVLSDVVLPDGNQGRDFADTAKALQPGIKVVFMSGYPAHAAEPDALEGTGDLFLRKPFKKEQLAEAIDTALEQPDPTQRRFRSAG